MQTVKTGNIIDDVASYLKKRAEETGYIPVSIKVTIDEQAGWNQLAVYWIQKRAREALTERGFYDS